MTTMIERVAQAIYEDRNGRRCMPWSKRPSAHKAPYLSDARAAIKAMREPTDHVLFLGAEAGMRAHETWPAMIDAALKEGEADADLS